MKKIAFVSSEVLPFAKTGGLSDVSGALPKSLAAAGLEVIVFMPLYSQVPKEKYSLHKIILVDDIYVRYGDREYDLKLYRSRIPESNVDVIFIDSPELFSRDSLYTIEHDEGIRFGIFNVAVLEAIQKLQWAPDIIHCNDWQSGLIPLLVKENFAWDNLFRNTSVVFTIHNIAYQGVFSPDLISNLGLNENHFHPMGPLEYYGKINFLKAALIFSDVIITVSETYSKEILTEEFGAGMQDILIERKKDLFGILNGVDYSEWDPENDSLIPYNYSSVNLSGKQKNKTELLRKIGFSSSENIPLIGIVSRLVEQKGTGLIIECIDELIKLNARWIILGSGTKENEDAFSKIGEKYNDKIFVRIGYDNEFAHLIEAGSDIFLMPSRYEPCGLNQIYSLKYGTVPIVRYTGGLADTVHDSEIPEGTGKTQTGFVFKEYSSKEMLETITRALNVFEDKERWNQIMINGMQKIYSWKDAAEKYIELYKFAKNKKQSPR